MPSRVIGPIYATPENLNKIAEWPRAWVKSSVPTISIMHGSRGQPLDRFRAHLWTTRTKSKTNTAGGSPGDALYEDRVDNLSPWKTAMNRWHTYDEETKRIIEEAGYTKKPDVVEQLPIPTGAQYHRGQCLLCQQYPQRFQFSNRMKLHDKLTLTLMGDFKMKKLRSRNGLPKSCVMREGQIPRRSGRRQNPSQL